MIETTTIPDPDCVFSDASGFSLVEFLVASIILLILSYSAFSSLNEIQQAASRQADTQEVLDNTRIALETVTLLLSPIVPHLEEHLQQCP